MHLALTKLIELGSIVCNTFKIVDKSNIFTIHIVSSRQAQERVENVSEQIKFAMKQQKDNDSDSVQCRCVQKCYLCALMSVWSKTVAKCKLFKKCCN